MAGRRLDITKTAKVGDMESICTYMPVRVEVDFWSSSGFGGMVTPRVAYRQLTGYLSGASLSCRHLLLSAGRGHSGCSDTIGRWVVGVMTRMERAEPSISRTP